MDLSDRVQDLLSYKWFYGFLQRFPHLKVKKPAEMSLYRAIAPSEYVIEEWWRTFSGLVERYNLSPRNIFNIDETWVMDQPKAQKVIIPMHVPGRGVQVVAGERGQLTTVLCFANAVGMVAPPTVIMKGNSVQKAWKEFLPEGWFLTHSHNGWVNKEIFLKTARLFVKWLEEQGLYGQRHIVLLDGHSSHSFNYPLACFMAAHKIHVVQFPPHCTHFLQPFDSVIYALLKKHWQDRMRLWNRQNAGQKLAKSSFFIPFVNAWRKAMTPANIQAAFRKTGVWPLDKSRIDVGWFRAREVLGEPGLFFLFPVDFHCCFVLF